MTGRVGGEGRESGVGLGKQTWFEGIENLSSDYFGNQTTKTAEHEAYFNKLVL